MSQTRYLTSLELGSQPLHFCAMVKNVHQNDNSNPLVVAPLWNGTSVTLNRLDTETMRLTVQQCYAKVSHCFCRKFGLGLRHIPTLALPIFCTGICYTRKWTIDLSPSLFITILVFPASFAMHAAYARREQVPFFATACEDCLQVFVRG